MPLVDLDPQVAMSYVDRRSLKIMFDVLTGRLVQIVVPSGLRTWISRRPGSPW